VFNFFSDEKLIDISLKNGNFFIMSQRPERENWAKHQTKREERG